MVLYEKDRRKQLEEELTRVEVEAGISHRMAMNSYGAGYDRGYADALKRAIKVAYD